MDDAASTPSVESVCRLCLSPDEPKSSIFERDDSSVPLSSKIQACLTIQVSLSDKLSTLICRGCIKTVNQWHSYRESCLKAQDKLHQWQLQQISAQTGVTIKQEPIDLEFETDHSEAVPLSHDSAHEQQNANDGVMALQITNEQTIRAEKDTEKALKPETVSRRRTRSFAVPLLPSTLSQESEKNPASSKPYCTVEVKEEPLQDDEYDSALEIESVTGGEILPNPVAINLPEKDRVMEADSTQRSNSVTLRTKRRIRRGPHTHLRNKHIFRKKCVYCQINLHSKYSYTRHMERFHSPICDSEQKDDKTGLKLVIKQKQKSTNSASASLQHQKLQTKISRKNSQRGNRQNIFEERTATVATNSHNKDVDEEMIEDVEDEIDNMDKNSETPLSQVQQNIIGQLKTYSCYSCKEVFPDRRSTLNHLRQHLPDLRPFTCVACLTQFPDRSIYKDHCYTSYECAMKIAIVEPKSGLEKYFTCNMCSKSVANRKELLNHLTSEHSENQQANVTPSSSRKIPAKIASKDTSAVANLHVMSSPGPYANGNPAYNHPCNYCGMIYKYERNLTEHRIICSSLPIEARISYACVHCGLTFLIFRKFNTHLYKTHQTTDITCSKCQKVYNSPSDFLKHYEKYYRNLEEMDDKDNERSSISFESPLKDWNEFEAEVHANESRISRQKYSCALCGQEFPTRTELGEHRNLHLKVKIYSCVICRSMFSSAGALEVHMKDHGIEDPAEQSAHTSCVEYEGTEDAKDLNLTNGLQVSESNSEKRTCKICNKSFFNVANQRRHMATVHRNRRKCIECNKVFAKKSSFDFHLKTEHRKPLTSPIKCPMCPQTFMTRANLNLHYETHAVADANTLHECDLCGKQFKEELSLKIHRGWHARRSRRLAEEANIKNRNRVLLSPRPPETSENLVPSAERPARARKSFPNSPPAKPVPLLQCQVCEDKFTEVTELRKHLWDVHCARNKNEKDYTTSDLQCELCTHTLPDKISLERHMEWHVENPILSDSKNGLKRKRLYRVNEHSTHRCEVCGNFYSSRGTLLRHQKLHKVNIVAAARFDAITKKTLTNKFSCNVCHKHFDNSLNLRKHRIRHFVDPTALKRRSVLEKSDFKCELCLKYYISELSLRLHQEKACPYRAQESTASRTKRRKISSPEEGDAPAAVDSSKPVPATSKSNYNLSVGWRTKKMVNCSICHKSFLGKSLFYKHRQSAHQKEIMSRAVVLMNKKASAATVSSAATSSDASIFRCDICSKDFPAALNLKLHNAAVHKPGSTITCNICRASFSTQVSLIKHMLTHSDNSVSCNLCPRMFRSRAAVYVHLRRQHPDEYDIMQDDKSKLYTEMMDTSHVTPNVQTPYNCLYCKMTFESKKALKIHTVRRHSIRN